MKKTMIFLFGFACLAPSGFLRADPGQKRDDREAFRTQQKAAWENHRQQQQSENKTFRDGLQGKSPEEKKAAVKDHREIQHKENAAFAAEQTEKRRAFLTQRLAANTKLTDTQKADLMAFHENQWKENDAYRETRYQESIAFFEKIAADGSLNQEQKKAAIKAHRDEVKAATQAHFEQQKAENKAKRDSLKQP